jgi:hypothetical protein
MVERQIYPKPSPTTLQIQHLQWESNLSRNGAANKKSFFPKHAANSPERNAARNEYCRPLALSELVVGEMYSVFFSEVDYVNVTCRENDEGFAPVLYYGNHPLDYYENVKITRVVMEEMEPEYEDAKTNRPIHPGLVAPSRKVIYWRKG